MAPLVGWQFRDPAITFTFDSAQTIRSVTLWFADSNGPAGVYMPESVTLTAGAFSQNFVVVNPPGAGTTVAVELSGFEVTTSSMRIDVTRNPANNWTMLSEAQFSSIPEPSAWAGLAGAAALALAAAYRRRN